MQSGEHKPVEPARAPKASVPPAGRQDPHAAMGHGGAGPPAAHLSPVWRATSAQLAAFSLLSVLALVAGLLFADSYTDLRLSARDVGGAVMPPGMLMSRDTPGEAMREMAAVDPRTVSYTLPADARGDRLLEARQEGTVKVYDLNLSVIQWHILPDVEVLAYAFNQQVPGPRIRLMQGDQVRFNVTNQLPEATSVHWHGLILPNAMDGAAEVTQPPIEPGQTFVYEFTVQQAGTFFYHSHHAPDRQQALGLYGALLIDPAPASGVPADLEYTLQLQEWLQRDGYTFPAMLMEGALPNFFTINGKAYPATETINMRVGQTVLLRFIGSHNNFVHPMHVHGGPFTLVATDGNPVPESAQIQKDTLNVGPGERYDVLWTAREPGRWLLHCHIPHHTTNNNTEEEGGGGLTLVLEVQP